MVPSSYWTLPRITSHSSQQHAAHSHLPGIRHIARPIWISGVAFAAACARKDISIIRLSKFEGPGGERLMREGFREGGLFAAGVSTLAGWRGSQSDAHSCLSRYGAMVIFLPGFPFRRAAVIGRAGDGLLRPLPGSEARPGIARKSPVHGRTSASLEFALTIENSAWTGVPMCLRNAPAVTNTPILFAWMCFRGNI
jgi:hypothetical protein